MRSQTEARKPGLQYHMGLDARNPKLQKDLLLGAMPGRSKGYHNEVIMNSLQGINKEVPCFLIKY